MIARRKFVQKSALGMGAALVAPTLLQSKDRSRESIRIGFIGTGLRGRNHINNILAHEEVICPAICDIDPKAVDLTLNLVKEKGHQSPKVYSKNEHSFKEMLKAEDLDAVIIATNWVWHTPMCVEAMENGVYTGVEVSGAFSIDECWDLVDTHERTGTHLMFMENVCYRRDVMAVLNMVRDDVFGELLHLRGGYLHDLRTVKFNDGDGGVIYGDGAYGEARWRTEHSLNRNGELYPTHGLGPINTMIDVNRGNRLTSLSSFATKAKSLKNFVKKNTSEGEDHPYTKLDWKLGDVVTTTISTANGETIVLTHDTNTPRPYSLGFRVQGVDGLIDFDKGTQRIYVEGTSPSHKWEDAAEWLERYDHKFWKEEGELAIDGGHGGMDYFLDKQFVESAKSNTAPVLDVYDAAVMRSITPLSEVSIRQGGAVQQIPDFTRGKWMNRKPVFGL
ncbi:MAG: Gfo/Idh/MocA family oxidoreductase [Cyclobacteriaceae bacterium]